MRSLPFSPGRVFCSIASPPQVHAMRALVEPMLKPMYGSATVSSISPYVAAKPRT